MFYTLQYFTSHHHTITLYIHLYILHNPFQPNYNPPGNPTMLAPIPNPAPERADTPTAGI